MNTDDNKKRGRELINDKKSNVNEQKAKKAKGKQKENSRKEVGKKKSSKKKKALIIAFINVFVIAGALIGAYFAYFTPEKRYDRSIKAADKAYDKKDYEDAEDNYLLALELDENSFTARLGLLKVYEVQNRRVELKRVFDDAIVYIRGVDDNEFADNKYNIVEIYLYASKVYKDDLATRIKLFEEIYLREANNRLVNEQLVKNYLELSNEYYGKQDMENEILAYNRVLELDAENEVAWNTRIERIKTALDACMQQEDFDGADALIDKYVSMVDGFDFETYRAEVARKRQIHDSKYELLTAVYDNLSNKEYEKMLEIDGSVVANFVSKHIDGSCVFTKEDGIVENYTGKAAAIISFKEDAYYFYYGDFVEGRCEGNGVLYIMTDAANKSYYLYDGEWKDNKPNGKGVSSSIHEYDEASRLYISREESGNFVDGLQNGRMMGTVILNESETYKGSWQTKNGVPKDVSSLYPDYPFSVPQGKVLYAVFLNSDESIGWGSWINKNGHLGVIPFVN